MGLSQLQHDIHVKAAATDDRTAFINDWASFCEYGSTPDGIDGALYSLRRRAGCERFSIYFLYEYYCSYFSTALCPFFLSTLKISAVSSRYFCLFVSSFLVLPPSLCLFVCLLLGRPRPAFLVVSPRTPPIVSQLSASPRLSNYRNSWRSCSTVGHVGIVLLLFYFSGYSIE